MTKNQFPISTDNLFAFVPSKDNDALERLCGGLADHVGAVASVFLDAFLAAAASSTRFGPPRFTREQDVLDMNEGLLRAVVEGAVTYARGADVPDTTLSLLGSWMLNVDSAVTEHGDLMVVISVIPLRLAKRLRAQGKIKPQPRHSMHS